MNSKISAANVKTKRTYTVAEAAAVVATTPQTIRKWVHKRGMPIVEGSLPWLILGVDLKTYASGTRRPKMPKPAPGEMTCMKCRQPRKADGGLADYVCHDAKTGRLVALCEECGSIMNLFTSRAKLSQLAAFFDIRERGDPID